MPKREKMTERISLPVTPSFKRRVQRLADLEYQGMVSTAAKALMREALEARGR